MIFLRRRQFHTAVTAPDATVFDNAIIGITFGAQNQNYPYDIMFTDIDLTAVHTPYDTYYDGNLQYGFWGNSDKITAPIHFDNGKFVVITNTNIGLQAFNDSSKSGTTFLVQNEIGYNEGANGLPAICYFGRMTAMSTDSTEIYMVIEELNTAASPDIHTVSWWKTDPDLSSFSRTGDVLTVQNNLFPYENMSTYSDISAYDGKVYTCATTGSAYTIRRYDPSDFDTSANASDYVTVNVAPLSGLAHARVNFDASSKRIVICTSNTGDATNYDHRVFVSDVVEEADWSSHTAMTISELSIPLLPTDKATNNYQIFDFGSTNVAAFGNRLYIQQHDSSPDWDPGPGKVYGVGVYDMLTGDQLAVMGTSYFGPPANVEDLAWNAEFLGAISIVPKIT